MAAMERHALWGAIFSGIDYKESNGDASVFPVSSESIVLQCSAVVDHASHSRMHAAVVAVSQNLFVKSCNEIIALGCSPTEISWRDSAQHLEPTEFHQMLLKHAAQRHCTTATAGLNACLDDTPGQGAGIGSGRSSKSVALGCDTAAVHQRRSGGSSPSPEAQYQVAGVDSQSDSNSNSNTNTNTNTNTNGRDSDRLVLLDCRNLYESEIGRFDGAVRCPTRHFTEFPAAADKMVDELQLRDKTVLMYCTGGIRCERASAYLRSVGVDRCYQLKGGIARYCEAF
eukprot:COSAG06_NODE_1646_length_8811_cov_6.796258_1_plen_283_part_10